MNFADLHELLRLELVRRIEAGTLTGTRLAQQTGFRQAHISNFLNRKRSLSLDGLDRVLASQSLTIDQILPVDLSAAASTPSAEPSESVPLVSPSVAMAEPRVSASSIIESVPISTARLYDQRSRHSVNHADWHRFLAVRVDVQQAAAMDPLLPVGSIAILDRHYTSLVPYHSHRATLYAVRCGSALLFRFVDLDDGHLILRPYSLTFPVQLLAIAPNETPSKHIVGRVCLVLAEV
jgi:hypothetical protein